LLSENQNRVAKAHNQRGRDREAAIRGRMKQTINRCAVAVRRLHKARPKETRWSIYGGAVGAFVGLFAGGIGVAALGTAFGVSASLVLGFIGGLIGNRVGVEKDHKARTEEAA
jgi:hypothetical protein